MWTKYCLLRFYQYLHFLITFKLIASRKTLKCKGRCQRNLINSKFGMIEFLILCVCMCTTLVWENLVPKTIRQFCISKVRKSSGDIKMKFQMELISNYICHGKHKDIMYGLWLLKMLSFLTTDKIQNLVKCKNTNIIACFAI